MNPPASPPAAARLRSLDALRGFDMFWIIGGAELFRSFQKVSDSPFTRFLAGQLEHSDWVGVRFYDLIYPLFLFLTGAGIAFSVGKSIRQYGKGSAILRIVRRGLLLVVLGMIYSGGLTNRWPQVRLGGVLALIGASYVLGALIYVWLGNRPRLIAGAAGALLALHWALLAWMPFPALRLVPATIEPLARAVGSHSPTVLLAATPGRVHGVYEHGYNFADYLDFRFLPGKKPEPYFEWEGLLSPLTAACLCLGGILAAQFLQRPDLAPARKAYWLLAGGLTLVGLGLAAGLAEPVVKKIWTSSFCLIGCGYGAGMLGAFYLAIDVWKLDRWCEPFVWIGMNPITIYLLVELVPFDHLSARLFGGDVRAFLDGSVAAGSGSVMLAAGALGLAMAVTLFLYRKKIFLRL